jgi:hypothetical protein
MVALRWQSGSSLPRASHREERPVAGLMSVREISGS